VLLKNINKFEQVTLTLTNYKGTMYKMGLKMGGNE